MKKEHSLEERIVLLEAEVRKLSKELTKKSTVKSIVGKAVSDTTADTDKSLSKMDSWMNKIGISLFLIGVAFFFKYALEQGWITSAVRIFLGYLLGGGLVFFGFKISEKNRKFSQVMFGGGIAVLYITSFAAFHIEKLFPFPLAFVFMAGVTALAFYLSLKFDDPALAIIAVIGGLGTPFILYTGIGDVTAIVLYTCLIITGSSVIFLYRGWYFLLWSSSLGGIIVFTLLRHGGPVTAPGSPGILAVQFGIIYSWLIQWAAGLMEVELGDFFRRGTSDEFAGPAAYGHYFLFLVSPLLFLYVSMEMWNFSNRFWGFWALGAAVLYLGAFFILRNFRDSEKIAATQWKVSLVLFTVSMLLVFDGNILLIILSLEVLALHVLSGKFSDKALAAGSNVMFIAIRLWLAFRLLFVKASGPAFFSAVSLSNVFSIIVLLAALRFLFNKVYIRYYFAGTCVLFLLWLLREISNATDISGISTLAWGTCAAALMVYGFVKRSVFMARLALITMAVTVGKLFFHDITSLSTLWKVVIFTGLGGLLLTVSYFLQPLVDRE